LHIACHGTDLTSSNTCTHTHTHTHTHTQPHTATHSHTQPHTHTHTCLPAYSGAGATPNWEATTSAPTTPGLAGAAAGAAMSPIPGTAAAGKHFSLLAVLSAAAKYFLIPAVLFAAPSPIPGATMKHLLASTYHTLLRCLHLLTGMSLAGVRVRAVAAAAVHPSLALSLCVCAPCNWSCAFLLPFPNRA